MTQEITISEDGAYKLASHLVGDAGEALRTAKYIYVAVNSHADLLAALETLVERGTDSPEHQAAERAIAKARGQ